MARNEELTLDQIGTSAYRAFCAACEGVGVRPMDEFVRDAWARVADVLGNNDGTFTVSELGNYVRSLYMAAIGAEASEGIAPTSAEAIAWQACGLHFYNLIQGADEGSVKPLELSWSAWAREQLSPAHEEAQE